MIGILGSIWRGGDNLAPLNHFLPPLLGNTLLEKKSTLEHLFLVLQDVTNRGPRFLSWSFQVLNSVLYLWHPEAPKKVLWSTFFLRVWFLCMFSIADSPVLFWNGFWQTCRQKDMSDSYWDQQWPIFYLGYNYPILIKQDLFKMYNSIDYKKLKGYYHLGTVIKVR